MIDDRSVARYGQWPLPREVVAAAITRLAQAGAKVIGLNLLFSESSRAVPAEVAQTLWRLRAALPDGQVELDAAIDRALAAGNPDTALAVAVASAGRVVLPYAFVGARGLANIAGAPPWVRATAYPVVAGPMTPVAAPAAGLLVPAPELAGVGASSGHVSLRLDVDGALRFDLAAFPYDDEHYPSLAVELARLFLGLPRSAVTVHAGRVIRLGDRVAAIDSAGRLLIEHLGPTGTIETVSFADVLDGTLEPARVAGRIVLLGVSATGAGDRFTTPFDPRLPGTEHIATAVDNLLRGHGLLRDARIEAADLGGVLLLSFAAAWLAGRRSYLRSMAVILELAAAWTLLALAAFLLARTWLGMLLPLLAVLLAGGAVEGLRIQQEQARRRRLERQRANLARYFPPTVVDRLAGADQPFATEGTQDVAVMFVDLMGFTRTSEAIGPRAAMALLRDFHALVETAVFAHSGMVDQYLGDGAFACFGVPDPRPTACADALAAARRLLAELAAWNAVPGHPPLKAGIGINFGPVLCGDIGGRQQFQFTVVGDTVNVASQLEALTRAHDAAIIISEAVMVEARATGEAAILADFEALEDVPIRGRAAPMRLWRLPRAA